MILFSRISCGPRLPRRVSPWIHIPSRKAKRRTISGVTKISCGVWTKLRFGSRRKPKPLPEISITPSPNSSSAHLLAIRRTALLRAVAVAKSALVLPDDRPASRLRFRQLVPVIGFALGDRGVDRYRRCEDRGRTHRSPLAHSAPGARSGRSAEFRLRPRATRRSAGGTATAGRRCGFLLHRGVVIGFFAHNETCGQTTGHDACALRSGNLLKPATWPAIRRKYLNWNRRSERRHRLRGSRTTATPEARSPHRRQELSYRE